MSYQAFQNRWIGKRVDADGSYGYQCVDLVKQYCAEEFGLQRNGAWGNAINWWTNPVSQVLNKFDRVATRDVRQGDIVVFTGINGNPYGHIGIANGQQTSTTVTVLEQNGSTGSGNGLGGNAIRLRAITKARVPGVLRPKAAAPAPSPGHKYAWAVGKTVYLTGVTWRVYKVGSVPPRTEVGVLRPNKYGGLSYKILATDKAPNSVVIQTQTYGKVSLPLGYGERIS